MTDLEVAAAYIEIMELEPGDSLDGRFMTPEKLSDWLKEKHWGDCINVPTSCARCQAEEAMRLVPLVRQLFNIQ